MAAGGELRRYDVPEIFEFSVGQVVDSLGKPVHRIMRASDAVIVDINYKTGLAWTVPAYIGRLSPFSDEVLSI